MEQDDIDQHRPQKDKTKGQEDARQYHQSAYGLSPENQGDHVFCLEDRLLEYRIIQI